MRILMADIGGIHCRFAVFGNSPVEQAPSGDPCRLCSVEIDFLAVLATGCLYVSGGVTARNENLVLPSHFCRAFVSSPSHGPFLKRLPVWVNINKDRGLFRSAACLGLPLPESSLWEEVERPPRGC